MRRAAALVFNTGNRVATSRPAHLAALSSVTTPKSLIAPDTSVLFSCFNLSACYPRPIHASSIRTMPPKKTSAVSGKRKAPTSASETSNKKPKATPSSTNGETHANGAPSDDSHGVVLRKYYPPEMSNARCQSYINNEIPRPIEELKDALADTKEDRDAIKVNEAVIHWFKCDLRTQDNKGLHLAAQKAKEGKVPLICLYIISPQDFEAHLTAPARVDFILRTLEVLKKDLAYLDIPLVVETVDKRRHIPARILELCSEWGASHIYANIEYEVDELRREAKLTRSCLENGISFNAVKDTCVVAPGELLAASSGKPYAVYTPWWRSWCKLLNSKPTDLDLYDGPGKNPPNTRQIFKTLFESNIPSAPENKQLTPEEKKRFKSMWPPGEHEAQERLQKFLKEKAKKYAASRNFPAENGTAVLSVHFAAGTLSARTAVYRAREASGTKKVDSGPEGLMTWISEIAWRDFYKHVMAHWPFVW
jgi:deoxyribodipyrimidine photo-lyase